MEPCTHDTDRYREEEIDPLTLIPGRDDREEEKNIGIEGEVDAHMC